MRIFEGGIESGEEFTSGGDEGDFERFTGGAKAFVEGFEDGVAADGVESGHVKSGAHREATAGDVALAFARAAVLVERGEAGQGGNGAIGDLAEFREVAEQGRRGARTDALNGAEPGGFGREFRGGFEQSSQPGDDFGEAFFEVKNSRLEILCDGGWEAWDLASGFGEEDGLQLLFAGDPGCEFDLCWRGRRRWSWTIDETKFREDAGIDAIGFGAAAGAASEVADLPWIDDGDGDAGLAEGLDDGALPTACGFTDDVARGLQRIQESEEGGASSRIVGKSAGVIVVMEIEGGFGDIKSDIDGKGIHGREEGSAL